MIRHGLLMTSIAGALFAAQGCNGDTRQEPPSSVEPSVAPQPDAAKVDAAPSAAELRSVAGPTDPGDEDRAGRAEGPTPSSPVADPVASWARRPSRIAIGRTHVCVVGPSDHPVCWGDAREGRIGSTRVDVTDYVQLASITAFSLAAGDSHTCGLATSGEVRCWGSNAEGQLGIDGVATATPIELDLGGVAHQLSARRGSTCAVSRDHGLSCWMPGGPARRIAAVDPARVAVGPGLDGCMLDFEGAGSCWGGTSTAGGSSLEPRAVEGLPPSRDIGVGDGYACALGRDGLVRCWGSNEGQRLGLPSSVAEQPTPTVVPDLPNRILQLAVGDASTCVLEDGGAVWCWGVNTEGQLGRGSRTASGPAARARGIEAAEDVAVGHDRACALAKDGTVWCWGVRPGTPMIDSVRVKPARLVALSDLVQCASTPDGRVGCWEQDDQGSTASFVEGVAGTSGLAMPDGGGCAIVEGRARCWGVAALTASHPDRDVDDTTPYTIEIEDVRSLDAIMERVCAIDGSGRVWCWGMSSPPSGADEMLAYGPTLVEGLEDAEELALARFRFDCARRTDGTLACWQPAHPERPMVVSRATTVPRLPPIVAIDGDQRVCALTRTNAIWCVDGTRKPRKEAVRLPARAKDIAMSVTQTCVVLEDDGVACWLNDEADLAESPITAVRIHGLDDVVQLVGKAGLVCAAKRDGSSACWSTPPPGLDDVPTVWPVLEFYRVVGDGPMVSRIDPP